MGDPDHIRAATAEGVGYADVSVQSRHPGKRREPRLASLRGEPKRDCGLQVLRTEADDAMTCTRGCTLFRKHKSDCRVEDGSAGVWVPAAGIPLSEANAPQAVVGAGTRSVPPEGHDLNNHSTRITPRGTLEVWHACNGCTPRRATHGCLCESCHLRMQGWLGIGPGSLRWAYDWVAPDLEPGQNAAPTGKIRSGKRVPPAALALHVHVLRQDIAAYLGGWLGALCDRFSLHGPDWWSWRNEEHQIPKKQREINEAAQYLVTWLDRIEQVPELVTDMYDEAQALLRRVIAQAPWEPKRTRLPKLSCPECERESVTIATGDEHLTCRRCGVLIPRAKYDRWSYLIASEKEMVS